MQTKKKKLLIKKSLFYLNDKLMVDKLSTMC